MLVSFYKCSRRVAWDISSPLKLSIVLLISVLNCGCQAESPSSFEEEKYSEENPLAGQNTVYRLSLGSNELFHLNSSKTEPKQPILVNYVNKIDNDTSVRNHAAPWKLLSENETEAEGRMDSVESEADVGGVEIDVGDVINEFELVLPSVTNYAFKLEDDSSEEGSGSGGGSNIRISNSVLLNRHGGLLSPSEVPASLDGEPEPEGPPEILEVFKRPSKYKPKPKRGRPPITIRPASSLPAPTTALPPHHHANNVSLKATFLSQDTKEESSSIELELSVNNGKETDVNRPQTQIQITNPTPDNRCLQLINNREPEKKKVLMNVWSYSGNRLKLESQKEIPPWVLEGTKVRDGEILNRGEIPDSVMSLIAPALATMSHQKRSDGSRNATVQIMDYFKISSEKVFREQRQRSRVMLHYILWGAHERTWRNMLDRTVENYLRNYIISALEKSRAGRVKEKKNWRKMRNVLLSFMASPQLNCSSVRDDEVTLRPPHPDFRPNPSKARPSGIRPGPPPQRPVKTPNKNDSPITRGDYGGGGGGGYGWQTNNGWGVQQQQGWGASQQGWGAPQQHGWGQPQESYGWGGWGDGDNKKSKKKKKKQKKKDKKKKKKEKKKKKKAKKKGKKGKGGGGGWGWRPPQQPQGWGGAQHPAPHPHQQGLNIDVTEILGQALTLWGLISLKGIPVLLLIAACLIIYLLSNKHGGGGGGGGTHYISSPPVIYSGRGWHRRTESPYDTSSYFDYDEEPHGSYSTHTPNPWTYQVAPSTLHPDPWSNDRHYHNYNATTPSPSPTRLPVTYLTSVDPPAHGQEQTTIPTNKRRLALSTSNELRNPHYQHDDYYDYETEYYNRQRKVPRIRTKQEEELLKILSKHKKETVDKLLQSWKLSKLKEVGWL